MNPLAVIGYPLLVVATANFCIGTILFARRMDDSLARDAGAMGFINAIYCWVMSMAYIRASLGLPYDLYYRAAWVGWIGMAPMAQVIFSLKGEPQRATRWGRALYAVWGSIWVLCLTTNAIEAGAVSLVPFVDRVGWLELPARGAGALTLCWALFELFRVQRASAGRRRQQIGYFLLGLALYAAAGMALAGVLPIVGGIHFDPGLVSYFSVAWMALTFYAITRHRLFDIRFVLSRVVVAVVLTLLLVAVQGALFEWIAPVMGVAAGITIVSVLTGAALFTTPLIALVEREVERLLVRRRADYGRAMKESVRMLATLGSVDDVLAQLLRATRDTVASTSATLLLREGNTFHQRQGYGTSGTPTTLAAHSPLARWLMENAAPFVGEEQERSLAPEVFASLAADLRAFGAEVSVAMRYRTEVLGILFVGRKADRDAFLQADLDLLETLANETAIAVTNARLLEDLQQAVRARDDFVSVAGHELRTPLMALHLNVHLVMRMLPEDAPIRGRLQAAERQVQRLTRLTDELLDVSRITAGQMTLEREPIDLGAVVQEVAARFADDLNRCGSQLELTVTETVIGRWDRLRIEQIVSNLLSNAVKYGGGQPITLTVESANGQARLLVRDRGIGIAAADQERIFDRFERAVASPRGGGFGLGLWITKQIVEAHGGTASVESTLGAGSTFRVELPLGDRLGPLRHSGESRNPGF